MKVAVFVALSYVTVPAILVPALFLSVNVVPVTVALGTASLNVALIEEPTATPVAPLVGDLLVTVGGVVSDCVCAAVVNDQLVVARGFSARSLIPFVRVAV